MLLVLATPTPAGAETWVSYGKLVEQVRHGNLIRAIINPQRDDVEIKFRNLTEWHAFYPRGQQRELQRMLDARHVRVLFVPRHGVAGKHRAGVHHRLRYVAGAIIAALLLAGGAFWLLRRGSRGGSRPRA